LDVYEISSLERDYWDSEIIKFPMAHPLNAFGWGSVRGVDLWTPHYYLVKEKGKTFCMMMVLEKKLPFLGYSILYAPKGPVWNQSQGYDFLKTLFSRIREDAKKSRAIFLRIDPNLPDNVYMFKDDPFIMEGFTHLEHRWTFWNSPRDVYRIDLTKANDSEELFNSLEKDARRCVRKAINEGVTIRPAESLKELRAFYKIFSQFSVDKGFMSRSIQYQEVLWNEFIANGNGKLFLAIYNNEIIGGLICLLFADKCLAMHMGTPYKYHNLQTSYAYLWESMKWAKEMGCVWYSFRGTGTTPTQESFKRKFNPQNIGLIGYYDLPLKPIIYKIFYFCEFEILPRLWRSVMKIRKALNYITSIKKSAC